MTTKPVSVQHPHPTTFRVLRGDIIMCNVVQKYDGWRVYPHSSSRKPSRKAWPSPREAFKAYWLKFDWAKGAETLLPDA